MTVGSVLILGGGISGMQSALDLADAGFRVYLVDKRPSIGGTMAQLDKTFPTNDCAMCLMAPKTTDCFSHPNISILSYSEIVDVKGSAGDFKVRILRHPRYVIEERCPGCGECAVVCPVKVKDEFNMRLGERKAAHRLFPQAVPPSFLIEKTETPPCQATCPAGCHAQGYIALIREGKYREAVELIKQVNPLPAICGRVCHHPCETMCSRNDIDEPVAIAALKRFVADYNLRMPLHPQVIEKRKEKVAIVGSGPAGLTAAYYLALRGYGVTIFEALPVEGGMLTAGIPEFILPRDTIRKEIDSIKALGVEIKTNTPVGKDLTLDAIVSQYSAVFIAAGLQVSRKLPIEGADLNGVILALPFLQDANLGKKPGVGNKVIVIGGGNVAIDVARAAIRLGAREVHVCCIESREVMPAFRWEIKNAEDEGAIIHPSVSAKRVLGKNGKVCGVEFLKVKKFEFDSLGKLTLELVEKTEHTIEGDMAIFAIGQGSDLSFLENSGISVTKKGTIEVDPVTLATNRPGIFAGGDIVSGPASAVDAIAAGKRAADSIDGYIRTGTIPRSPPVEKKTEFPKVKEYIQKRRERGEITRKEREKTPVLPLVERVRSFSEVHLGYTEEAAKREAERCLSCGICSACYECIKACGERQAINHEMKEEYIDLDVGSIVLSPGLEVFDASQKPEYGYGVYSNVVTSLEFERILSSSGPFSGVVKRPSDGATPKKIAFIQCVGSRDKASGNTYCSSVCCMYAIKQAVIAQEHAPGLRTHIFFMDVRAFGKEFEYYRMRAENEYGVKITRNNKVASIEEIPDTGNLLISYIDEAEIKEEEFDMVVLSVGLRPAKDAKHLSSILNMKLNRHGFCETEIFSPVRTSAEGIYASGVFVSPKDIPDTVAQASASAAAASSPLWAERGKLVTVKEYPPETNVSGQEPRIGVFICRCGINIGGVVDVPSVVEYTKKLPGVVHAEENIYTCSQDSQQKIKSKIKESGLNRVIVASCTPRTHERLFQNAIREAGLNEYLFEMANIREHCSWVHMHEKKDATEKAKAIVRMVVAKARLLEPLKKSSLGVVKKALVIGGGIAGMTAALETASQGFEVYLIEREKELGGNASKIHYTLGCDNVQEKLKSLIDRVRANEKITLYTGTEIEDICGYIGNFKTTFSRGGETKTVEHGVVIVAVGAKQYHPAEYMYGKDPRVLTTLEFEGKLMKEGTKAKNIVMVQCVGSRDETWPGCSRVCCSNAIANALKVKEKSPETNVYILYKDIRTYGFREDYYTEAARQGTTFIRYYDEHKPVVSVENGRLEVRVREAFIDEEVVLHPDLFVISAGIRPNEDNENLAKMLKVPLSRDGSFLEAHMKLRPLDFATGGIFLCGLAHGPKFIDENISQALGAAARACTILSKTSIEGEAIIAVADKARCRGCGRCEEECEFKAPKLVEEGGRLLSQINEALCKGCGRCAARCCNGAISMRHFSSVQISAMIEAALAEAT